MSKQNRLLFGAFNIGIGSLISMIISFFTTPVITRIFMPDEYGMYSLFIVYGNMAMMVLTLGMDQALVRYYYDEKSYTYRVKLIWACIRMPLVLTGIVTAGMLLFWSINKNYNKAWEFDLVVLFSIYVFIILVNRFLVVVLRLEHRTGTYAFANIVQKASFVMVVIAFVFICDSTRTEYLIYALIISFLFSILYGGRKIQKIIKLEKDEQSTTHDFCELFRYSFPLVFALGLTTLFQALDRMFIYHYYSSYEVGIYASAVSVIHVFEIVQASFTAVWMPSAIEKFSEDKEEKGYYVNINEVITLIMFFLGATLILFKDVIVLLLGEKYRETARIIPFLVFSPIMYTISETTVIGLVFLKKSKMQVVAPLVSCLVNFIGNSILVPRYGYVGAAISTAISYTVFMIIRTVLSNKYYYVEFKIMKMLICTGLLFIYSWYEAFHSSIIISLLFFIGILLVLYWGYRKRIRELLIIVFKNNKYVREKY